MIDTGIYIRALVDGDWCSVDIADPRLSIDQLSRSLLMMDEPGRIALMHALLQVVPIDGMAAASICMVLLALAR